MATKQYGLIIPKKSKQAAVQRPSVFDNDSEEEKEDNSRSLPTEAKLDTWKSKVKKKTQLEMKKVLEEDPTVYEYDSIYDNMQKEKEDKAAEVINKSKDRKPRYIESLMMAADSRKKEYERRVERTIQKEREQEGDEFKDKEAFVTSAYKKKMLEMQEQEEKERKEREAEEKMDVMKQKDLSGFYRHLLKQTAGDGTAANSGETEPNVSTEKQNSSQKADVSPDDKQSSELVRAKKAVEELKKSSSKIKESSSKKRYSDNSDEESHKSSNHLKKTNKEKLSEDETSDDNSNDEGHKRTKRKHKSRHENSHKHKKSKSRHHHSDSEEETKHSKKHRHSKHKSSHKDDRQRKDKHRAHYGEKHKRSTKYSSDSDSH